jgi:hypothetical protein
MLFFKLRVRRLPIVPQFQGHPGSEALTAAVSLPETRRITMEAQWHARSVG